MNQSRLLTRRSTLIAALAGLEILQFQNHARADSATGVDALDTAAIRVRKPETVLLIAICRAGERLVAAGEHGVVIYSDDQGVTWSQASVPVNVTLTCLAFATPQLGWAAGHFGAIIHTADGGKTWYMQLNGLQANQLTLAAAQAASLQNSSSPGAPLALRRAEFFVQAGPSKPFLAILVMSSQKVIVFGAYRMTMMTMDGGESWVDSSLQIGDRFSHNLYDVASIGGDAYLVGEVGMVFRSSDGGDSFPAVASPSATTLLGVVGASNESVIVYGVAGNCFSSTDRGASWTSIPLSTQDNITAGRRLSSEDILLGSESGGLFVSKDNGTSFDAVPNVPPMSIFDFEQAADGTIIFVGSAGVRRVSSLNLNS
jgi:photosystem II stability/assembly factor-like uncharacterized protein